MTHATMANLHQLIHSQIKHQQYNHISSDVQLVQHDTDINSTRATQFPYIYCSAESHQTIKTQKTTNKTLTAAQQNFQ